MENEYAIIILFIFMLLVGGLIPIKKTVREYLKSKKILKTNPYYDDDKEILEKCVGVMKLSIPVILSMMLISKASAINNSTASIGFLMIIFYIISVYFCGMANRDNRKVQIIIISYITVVFVPFICYFIKIIEIIKCLEVIDFVTTIVGVIVFLALQFITKENNKI